MEEKACPGAETSAAESNSAGSRLKFVALAYVDPDLVRTVCVILYQNAAYSALEALTAPVVEAET